MKIGQRVYKIQAILVNDIKVNKVVIDPHYEKKHAAAINDSLILALVRELNRRQEVAESKLGKYAYFATLIEHKGKQYRLIWLMEDGSIYVGVVNVYRDRRRS